MNCQPIFCSGNELKSVLDGIENRKGVVTDLHTGVGGNAGYRVNYFNRFPFACGDCDPCLGGRPDQCVIFPHKPHYASSGTMQSEPDLTRTVKGVRQVAGHITTKTSVAAGNDKRAEKPQSVIDAPASIFPQQGETPEQRAAPDSVKGAAAPRNRLNGVQSPRQTPASGFMPLQRLGIENPASCAETAAVENSLNAGKNPMTSAGKSPKGSDQVTPEELHATKLQSGVERQTESRVEDCHQHSIATRLAALQEKLAAAGKIKRSKTREARLPHPND